MCAAQHHLHQHHHQAVGGINLDLMGESTTSVGVGGQDMNVVKCVVVGDTGVGKSRLICSRACGTTYTLQQLIGTHIPAVWAIDHYRNDKKILERSWCKVDGVNVSLQLWDTFGYHDKNRSFAYGRADVILICYDAVSRRSLHNVKNHWIREIYTECPRVPIVVCACKIDLRHHYNDPAFIKLDKGPFYREISVEDIVSPEEGRQVALSIGADYYETSVWAGYGVDDVFINVARSALYSKRLKNIFSVLKNLKHVRKPHCQAPYPLPKPPPPIIKVSGSSLISDLRNLLERELYSDVVFVVQGMSIRAHRICLMAASHVFEELFTAFAPPTHQQDKPTSKKHGALPSGQSKVTKDTARLLDNEELQNISSDNLDLLATSSSLPSSSLSSVTNCKQDLRYPAFMSLEYTAMDSSECFDTAFPLASTTTQAQQQQQQPRYQAVITVNACITPAALKAVLLFLYTGECTEDASLLTDLCITSKQMGLTELTDIATNLLHKQSYKNMELQRKHRELRGQRMYDLAVKQALCSDVQFQVDNGVVDAHKALMMSHSDVMQSMFSYNFRESCAHIIPFPGTSKGIFQALLEFLYTGNCSHLVHHQTDILQLIELANRLCLPRLLEIAEQYICEQLSEADSKGIDITEEVFSLLEPAQLHNAVQLADWCEWYLCVHYKPSDSSFTKLLRSLSPDNQVHITSNKWPPAWHVKEEEHYERCLIDLEREKLGRARYSIRRSKSEDDDSGCLGFCSRNRQKVKRDACVPAPSAIAI